MKSLVTYRTKPTIGTITPAVGQKSSFGNQMYVLACLQTTDCDARTEPALTSHMIYIARYSRLQVLHAALKPELWHGYRHACEF